MKNFGLNTFLVVPLVLFGASSCKVEDWGGWVCEFPAKVLRPDSPQCTVPTGLDLTGYTAIVVVEDKSQTRHGSATGLASTAKVKFESALQKAGLRINDHAASADIARLLEEIRQNQDSASVSARLDQLGVDIVFMVEIGQFQVEPRQVDRQDQMRYNASFSMTLRGIDPRSAAGELFGDTSFCSAVRDESNGTRVARSAIGRLAEKVQAELVASRQVAEFAAAGT
jgi:hypothetical protein